MRWSVAAVLLGLSLVVPRGVAAQEVAGDNVGWGRFDSDPVPFTLVGGEYWAQLEANGCPMAIAVSALDGDSGDMLLVSPGLHRQIIAAGHYQIDAAYFSDQICEWTAAIYPVPPPACALCPGWINDGIGSARDVAQDVARGAGDVICAAGGSAMGAIGGALLPTVVYEVLWAMLVGAGTLICQEHIN